VYVYLIGLAPNFWGELSNGRHIVDEMRKYGVGYIGGTTLTDNKGVLYRALASVFENVRSITFMHAFTRNYLVIAGTVPIY
jgi:hypothetical protein